MTEVYNNLKSVLFVIKCPKCDEGCEFCDFKGEIVNDYKPEVQESVCRNNKEVKLK